MIDKLFPLNELPIWLPWMFLALLGAYIVTTTPTIQTVIVPDTITSPNQLDAYLTTAQQQDVYSYIGANTIPSGNAWI